MLTVYHSPTNLISPVHFSLFSFMSTGMVISFATESSPLQFSLPDVVISTDTTPTHWAFYFQGSGVPLSVSGSWSGSMCRAHVAWQELQAIAIMLGRMAFCLSGKVVALHLDNSTAKAYLCNQGGIPAYIPTHLSVEADYLSWGWLLLEWHLLPQMAQAAFCFRGLPEVDLLASSHTIQYQHYYTLETPLPLGDLELNAFNYPWMFQVSYVFPPLALVPL